MSKLDEKLEHFKNWQKKIMDLDQDTGKKLRDLSAEYEAKSIEIKKELTAEVEKYKVDFKATFGLCDGEKNDILSLIECIKAVNELSA